MDSRADFSSSKHKRFWYDSRWIGHQWRVLSFFRNTRFILVVLTMTRATHDDEMRWTKEQHNDTASYSNTGQWTLPQKEVTRFYCIGLGALNDSSLSRPGRSNRDGDRDFEKLILRECLPSQIQPTVRRCRWCRFHFGYEDKLVQPSFAKQTPHICISH